MPTLARAIFGVALCTFAICGLTKPAQANCATASRYVAASEQAEKRFVASRVYVSGDALNKLASDAASALGQARSEPCGSTAVTANVDALEAWYQMEDHASLWSLAQPTTPTNQPNPPECAAYYAAESKVVRAAAWYLLWQSYATRYRSDIQWTALHSMDETNAHIPIVLPPFNVNAAAAAATKGKFTGELASARRMAGPFMYGDDCLQR